ncbi:MAG: acetoin utilization protein AcuC [Promethearchaeota archaeon]
MGLKIGLIFSSEYEKYNFGSSHPLRPLRLMLTYSLFEKLGLLNNEKLDIISPRLCSKKELEKVHSPKYIEVVKNLSENPEDRSVQPYIYGLGPGDNPVFKGMYEASSLVCGASLKAAEKVWKNDCYNIAFNPSGGLHHAMRKRASGFCIFNDIAVAIKHLKSLQENIKIAYLDIDCHHGDGVQWLFYEDPNVLTISFHEDGRFLFPGSGNINEIGKGEGKGFSLNFPLLPGTSNKMYLKLFKSCVPKILQVYEPDILITQLGVDTYYKDPLTQMGLSIAIYKNLAQTIRNCARDYCQNKWVALGGGGYLMTVVPRVWSLFLAKMLDVELKNELPNSWIKEVKEKVPHENTPHLLWDNNNKIEVQLLSHPELAKKMIDYVNSLISVCEEKYLPNLKKD